ncbi:MAG: S9 family peptidase, partial [Bacteroidota bacterium]
MKIEAYPTAEKKDSVLLFHGEELVDPYIWLEDDRSEATAAWVKSQQEVTGQYLSGIPYRESIRKRYTELFNFEKVGAPVKAGEYYFIFKNSGLEPQGKIFVRKGLDGPDELFLDINALSADGTVSADLLGANDENTLMAVSISESGSDWSRIVIYDIATRQPTSDVLRWVKFSGAA